jgi:hypothetical protein
MSEFHFNAFPPTDLTTNRAMVFRRNPCIVECVCEREREQEEFDRSTALDGLRLLLGASHSHCCEYPVR